MRKATWLLAPVLFGLLAQAAAGAEITPAGKKLAGHLDGMNVERLWLPSKIVAWKTGETIKEPTDGKAHTHCSAFVAAACERCGVYILRPPEHPTVHLANAQYAWLRDEGAKKGWSPVSSPMEAQRLANQGNLVVAVMDEKDEKKHGHVALLRPSTKSARKIQEEGPQIIQAGMDNYASASLKEGFKHHSTAWREKELRYYVHAVNW